MNSTELAGKRNCPGFGGHTPLDLSLGVFRRTVSEPGEKDSLLRMGLLFLITLGSAATTSVLALANVLAGAVRWLLGETQYPGEFSQPAGKFPGALYPLLRLWAYTNGATDRT